MPDGVSTRPWSGAASGYKDADAYCRSCLIDQNLAGVPKVADRCKLPVREPNGTLNRSALAAAASALAGGRGGIDATPAEKSSAAVGLVALYRAAGMIPPPSLRDLAGDTSGGMNRAIRTQAGYR